MDDSLSPESFLEGAKKAAHRAMDDHGRGEYDEFALHAGVAVERLAKAVLVSKNPIYIAEVRNADMVLYLGGDLELSMDKVRTVGAKDAIARLRRLTVLKPDAQLDMLIELRNGVAHTSSGGAEAREMISPLARTIETLLDHLDVELETFWDRWTEAVRVALDEQRSEVERSVQVRIRQARNRFADRFDGLPEGLKERALRTPEPGEGQVLIGPLTAKLGEKTLFSAGSVPCPACESSALLTLFPISSSDTGKVLSPGWFKCRMCGLELKSLEEIEASGADTEKAMLPSTITVSYGPTVPIGFEMGETHAG